MSRISLKDQLKALDSNDDGPLDPENAYSSLDTVTINGPTRDDYLEVGPSRLRDQIGNGDQVLLGDKYSGTTVKRNKIFDDEESDEDDFREEGHNDDEGDDFSEDDDGASEDDEDNEDEDVEDEDGDENGEDAGGDSEDSEDEDEEDSGGDQAEDDNDFGQPTPEASSSRAGQRLDPVGALRQARAKDIERGRGIRHQKALFDAVVTLRITFQKALIASNALPSPFDPSGELDRRKAEALDKLLALSDGLFELRRSTALPETDTDAIAGIGKRKRGDSEDPKEYLISLVNDSTNLADAQRPALVSTMNKWDSKIQAATISVASKAAGSSKFLQTTKTQQSMLEVIQAGLSNAVNSENTFMENEETGYRALLREVIESRSAGGGADLTHLRREKKKKREAERGGSKGRKLRYTVHEKAQHFAVPVPLRNGWHEEQIDELFSSLLDGAGLKGAGTEGVGLTNQMRGDTGLTDLGGLRVF